MIARLDVDVVTVTKNKLKKSNNMNIIHASWIYYTYTNKVQYSTIINTSNTYYVGNMNHAYHHSTMWLALWKSVITNDSKFDFYLSGPS